MFENRSLSRIASKPSIEEKYVLLKSDLRMGFVCKQIDTQPFLQKRSPNLSVLRIICEDEQALTNLNSNWWPKWDIFDGFEILSCFEKKKYYAHKYSTVFLFFRSLSSNQLSTLPKELIEGTSRLDTLTLDDNPWVCDCRLNWLILWLQSTTRVSRSAASTKIPICMEPIGYQGQRLTSIRPLQCSEGE